MTWTPPPLPNRKSSPVCPYDIFKESSPSIVISGAMGVLPAKDGTVFADTDDGLLVRADTKFVHLSTVADSNVGHTTFLIIPHL